MVRFSCGVPLLCYHAKGLDRGPVSDDEGLSWRKYEGELLSAYDHANNREWTGPAEGTVATKPEVVDTDGRT